MQRDDSLLQPGGWQITEFDGQSIFLLTRNFGFSFAVCGRGCDYSPQLSGPAVDGAWCPVGRGSDLQVGTCRLAESISVHNDAAHFRC